MLTSSLNPPHPEQRFGKASPLQPGSTAPYHENPGVWELLRAPEGADLLSAATSPSHLPSMGPRGRTSPQQLAPEPGRPQS